MILAVLAGGMTTGTVLLAQSVTSTLGTANFVVAVLIGVAAVASTIYGVRWKSNAERAKYTIEVTEDLARSLEAQRDLAADKRDELAAKLEDQNATLVEAQRTIARLEALPNLERVLELVADTFERIAARLDETANTHERRAVRRHRQVLEKLRDVA